MKMKSNTKKLVVRYVFFLAAALIMVFIFLNSAQTAEQSTETSGSFTEKLLTAVLPSFSGLEEAEKQTVIADMQFVVRKSAHFSVYLALGVCLFSAFNTYRIKTRSKALLSIFVCLLYAISDEVHQLFVAGRSGQVTDVLIDLAGTVLGVLVTLGIISAYRKARRKKINKGEYPVKKKELVNRLNELINSMNSLQRQLAAVQKENEELKAELRECRNKPAEVIAVVPEKETVTEPKGFTVTNVDFSEQEELSVAEPADEAQPESVTKEKTAPSPVSGEPVVLADEAMEYGSIAIGTVVQESIRYANLISASASENKKELLNLIMGKGEVAKAEIFSIAESDSSVDVKRDLIDGQVAETVDYFKSVAGQI